LNPAHKSGDAWVRIASSVQSRGGRPLILEYASCRDCTLEAMRTQVFANQCIDCTVVLFAHASSNSEVANEPASTIIHAAPGYYLDILAKVLPRGSSLHELPIFPQLRARGQ
jgi:hypothetical protein